MKTYLINNLFLQRLSSEKAEALLSFGYSVVEYVK